MSGARSPDRCSLAPLTDARSAPSAMPSPLMQTPLLREFDLAADNWDNFMPHQLATLNIGVSRRFMEENGVAPLRFNLDMSLTVWVRIVRR